MSVGQKTAISILQEYCVRSHLPIPRYEFAYVAANSRNYGHYQCTVIVSADIKAEGVGPSKQTAKQESAKNVLELINVPVSSEPIKDEPVVYINAVGELNEFSSKHGLGYPEYKEGTNEHGHFVVECTHLGFKTLGVDIKKKQAKQKAANTMLQNHTNNKILEKVAKDPPKMMPTMNSSRLSEIYYSDDEIAAKYQEVTPLKKSYKSSRGSKEKISSSTSEIDMGKRSEGVKALVKAFEALEIKYSINEIQDYPCILGVQFSYPNGGNDTIVETGQDYDSVLENIFQSGMKMYSKK